MNNDFKNDTQLLFACKALAALHGRIEPAERVDYLLTFRAPGDGGGDDGGPEHPQARMGWRQYSINCLAGERVDCRCFVVLLAGVWGLPLVVGQHSKLTSGRRMHSPSNIPPPSHAHLIPSTTALACLT
jgi:hypothetical protein